MRASTILVVVLLVLTGLVAPSLANAQDAGTPAANAQSGAAQIDPTLPDREAGTGVTFVRRDVPGQTDQSRENLALYEFTFEPFAYLPEHMTPDDEESPRISPEAMLVFVNVGPVMLYAPPGLTEGAVVVVSADGEVLLEQWADPTTRLVDDEPCRTNPCQVPEDTYAILETGDYALHRAGSYCPYCNESDVANGVITVSPLVPEDGRFSWTDVPFVEERTAEATEAAGSPAAEEANGTPAARRMGWRLNPDPACGGRYS